MQWSETKHCRPRSFYDMMVPVIEMKEKKKDSILSVRTKCIQLDASGKGLVKIKDEKVLIENLLPGEEVELEYTRGRGIRVVSAVRLTDSLLRVKPRCRVFDRCGGCQLQHVDYPAQLDWKKEKVQQLLGRYGRVHDVLGMAEPWAYRNKVIATFSLSKKGKVIAGIYEEDSHQLVPYSSCWIQDPIAEKILATVCELMTELRIEPYDEDQRTGLVRHCLIRVGHVSREVLVCLVCASPIFPARKQLIQRLRQRHPEITTIVMNVNSRNTSVVLGSQERVLVGPGKIQDELCGLKFSIAAKSFYQINSVQTEVLYGKAMELANLTGKERVLDAYCGIGSISLVAAKAAKEVVGVEVNPVSVKNAIENARMNHLRNAWFVEADAGLFMEQAAREGQAYDVVFMDPPRAGADERFLKSLCRLNPDRIVYISCNPSTQARDLRHLTHEGYQVRTIVPVDLFPMTSHVETICLLVKTRPSSKTSAPLSQRRPSAEIPPVCAECK